MSDSHPKRTRPVVTLLLASIALVATVGLALVGSQLARLRVENALLLQQLQLTDLQMRSQQTQLEAEQIITQAQLRGATSLPDLQIQLLQDQTKTTSDITACIVWTPSQHTGLIFAENLPTLADNQEYRLWAIHASNNVQFSCGAFQSGEATVDSPFQFQLPAKFLTDNSPLHFGVSIEIPGIDSPSPVMVLSSK